MDQVTLMKAQRSLPDMVDATPEQFFGIVRRIKNGKYNLVARLGQALLSIYNSSSEAERDFSVQHALVGDSHKNSTSQLRLQMRMRIKSSSFQLIDECKKCNTGEENEEVEGEEGEDEEGEKKSSCPCHCSQFEPSDDMLAKMKGGQPNRSYRKDLDEQKKKNSEASAVGELNYVEIGGAVKEMKDLKVHVEKWKKNIRKQREEEVEKEADRVKAKSDRIIIIRLSISGPSLVRRLPGRGQEGEGGQEEEGGRQEKEEERA